MLPEIGFGLRSTSIAGYRQSSMCAKHDAVQDMQLSCFWRIRGIIVEGWAICHDYSALGKLQYVSEDQPRPSVIQTFFFTICICHKENIQISSMPSFVSVLCVKKTHFTRPVPLIAWHSVYFFCILLEIKEIHLTQLKKWKRRSLIAGEHLRWVGFFWWLSLFFPSLI